MKDIFIGAFVGAILLGGFLFVSSNSTALAGISDAQCTATTTRVNVGNQLSTSILSAAGNRAWASVQLPANATNTVYLGFGITAISGMGYILEPVADGIAPNATTSPSIQFGRNALLPYTGAVNALTSLGSSTLIVTECTY